jgi:hypothetical protein
MGDMIKLLSLQWKASGNTPAVGHSGWDLSRDNVGIRQLKFGGPLGGIGSALGNKRFSSVVSIAIVRVTMTKRIFFLSLFPSCAGAEQ